MSYNLLKLLHIWLVISWFAGLFYLPRIFVNIALVDQQSESSVAERARLILMANKLYRFMLFLAIPAVITGLSLWIVFSFQGGWLHAKTTLVVILIVYHWWCGRILNQLKSDKSQYSDRKFRIFNEIPVVVLLVVLYLVIYKPF